MRRSEFGGAVAPPGDDALAESPVPGEEGARSKREPGTQCPPLIPQAFLEGLCGHCAMTSRVLDTIGSALKASFGHSE